MLVPGRLPEALFTIEIVRLSAVQVCRMGSCWQLNVEFSKLSIDFLSFRCQKALPS